MRGKINKYQIDDAMPVDEWISPEVLAEELGEHVCVIRGNLREMAKSSWFTIRKKRNEELFMKYISERENRIYLNTKKLIAKQDAKRKVTVVMGDS